MFLAKGATLVLRLVAIGFAYAVSAGARPMFLVPWPAGVRAVIQLLCL